MKKCYSNKISKTILLFLVVILIGIFCIQIVSANQSGMMLEQEFSHTKSATSNMMPCCEENSGHLLAISDLPSTRYPLQILSLILAVVSACLVLFENIFSKYSFSYSILAPPGPDLMLAVVKKE